MNNCSLNQIETTLRQALVELDKAKLAKAIATTPFCGSYDLNDTVNMMNSDSYKDRIRAEIDQLLIRIHKLEITLKHYKEETLTYVPHCSYELLYEQLVYMKQYLRVLSERAKIEGVE